MSTSVETSLDLQQHAPAGSAPAGVARLDATSARIKRFTALLVMLIPFFGFVAALYQMWAGRFTSTDLIVFAAMYAVHMIGITVGFHRYLAHKTFRTSSWFEGLLLIAGSMGVQGPIMFWVTTHRRHHLYSDSPGDPHSPNLYGGTLKDKLRGLWYAHMPWMLAPETSGWNFFAPDILRNRRLFFFHRTYFIWVALGIALPALIGYLIDGTAQAVLNGVLFGGLSRIFLANQASWCVGSISHMIGSRPYETGDHSANNWFVAVLTFGEGLQNNHHAFPAYYRHGVKWWEPDLSGWLLGGLAKLGVVWGLRIPDRAAIRNVKQTARQR